MANHELYVVQGKTLDNIAGTMRAVLGVDKDAPIRFDEVANSDKTEQINTDIETQTDLIAQIKKALEGKASISAAEIMALIDESKVLDSTDGTPLEKVENVLLYADVARKIYEVGTKEIVTMPPMNYSSSSLRGKFTNYSNLETIMGELDCTSTTDLGNLCNGCSKLKSVTLRNTENVTAFMNAFRHASSLESVTELDFSSATNNYQCFQGCNSLKEIRFVEETIKVSIEILSPVLTIGNVFDLTDTENVGSVQNIINGLATLAEGAAAQTLTLSKNLPLTEEQKQAITTAVNNKGWTLAFA